MNHFKRVQILKVCKKYILLLRWCSANSDGKISQSIHAYSYLIYILTDVRPLIENPFLVPSVVKKFTFNVCN